ncbi:MAG: SCO2524 family protein, partial [Actinomycetota bacterium]|nr:SCO2524 family protein [Actinomycetota bacterium]
TTSNSISDAEQVLCLMYPAAEVVDFKLDVPDETAEDVLAALKVMGDSVEIPKLLIDVLTNYMSIYLSESGTPIFSAGSYFQPRDPDAELTSQQRALDVVDSFATSISLALSTLGFLKVFSRSVRRPELRAKISRLEEVTSNRLSAAMVGLLRSFTVNVFEPDSTAGRALIRTINQNRLSERTVLKDLTRRLQPTRASLRDAILGLSQDDRLDNENMLFECGWSWSVVRGAPAIETLEPIGVQPEGVAIGAPYLYFTVVALDGIADLFSERVRVLGLLNAEQQRLAQALQVRWDVTMGYWSAIARFGDGRWPLEDLPWRTTDEEESDYFSLLVTAVVLLDLLARRATDDDLTRTVAVLEELAARGRINRRVMRDDPAIGLHAPGVQLELVGSEDHGPPMIWTVADFAALLLKRSVRAAGLSRNTNARDRLLAVAEDALGHLWSRRLKTGPATGLWDDPSELFPGMFPSEDGPSWYLTERVVECLVMAAHMVDEPPIRSPQLIELTVDLLSEADHLFGQDLLAAAENGGSAMHASLERIEARLERARRMVTERPGTAFALVNEVLRELDGFALARSDAARGA